MCNFACDETTELIKAGQTKEVSGVVERAGLSPRGKGEGGKKSQDEGNRRHASVVRRPVIARVNTRTTQLQ